MSNCYDLSFDRYFSLVEAHQDECKRWEVMDWRAQLNSGCDTAAKQQNFVTVLEPPQPLLPFPLEPATLYIQEDKLTKDLKPTDKRRVKFSSSKRF